MANLVRIQAIRDELDTDPLVRGYAGMTNQQASDSLNAVDQVRIRSSISGSEIFKATNSTEFDALTDAQRAEWLRLCAIDEINPSNATPAAAIVARLFGGGSTTIGNLAALRNETVSRATVIGVGTVNIGDVENARSL